MADPKYYAKHKEYLNTVYMKEWREKNPEKVKAQQAKHYQAHKEKFTERNYKYYRKNWASFVVSAAKRRAKKNGIPFDLSYKDIEIPETCPVLGIPISPGDGKTHDGSPSLDRMRPELGYVKSNVQVISHKANRIKSNGSAEEIAKVLAYILDN